MHALLHKNCTFSALGAHLTYVKIFTFIQIRSINVFPASMFNMLSWLWHGTYAGSFAGLGFLSLYLSAKIRAFDSKGHVAKLCIVFFPLLVACLVGISRVDDYWHHWQDVFAGGLIGLALDFLLHQLKWFTISGLIHGILQVLWWLHFATCSSSHHHIMLTVIILHLSPNNTAVFCGLADMFHYTNRRNISTSFLLPAVSLSRIFIVYIIQRANRNVMSCLQLPFYWIILV